MDFHHILSTSHLHSSTTAPVPFPANQPSNTNPHHHQLPGISYLDSHQTHSYDPSSIHSWYNANITSYPLTHNISLAPSYRTLAQHPPIPSIDKLNNTEKLDKNDPLNPLNRPLPRDFSNTLFPYSIQSVPKGKPRNKRTFISQAQVKELEKIFEINNFPTSEVRSSIANKLGLSNRSVQIWFQNRRQGRKKQMTSQGSGQQVDPNVQQTKGQNYDGLFPYSKSTIASQNVSFMDSYGKAYKS